MGRVSLFISSFYTVCIVFRDAYIFLKDDLRVVALWSILFYSLCVSVLLERKSVLSLSIILKAS